MAKKPSFKPDPLDFRFGANVARKPKKSKPKPRKGKGGASFGSIRG